MGSAHVFEGGAYGVGVTVTSLEPVPWPEIAPPPGVEVHPARLGELMPVAARTRAERAVELERVVRVEARLAERASDVTVHSLPDGMAELRSVMPQPLAAAIRSTVDTYARMAEDDGDGRLLGQLRVGVLADLVLRSWDTSRPPGTAALTVVAPLDALHPDSTHGVAEVCGEPITATHLRELLRQLDSLCPSGLQPPAGGSLDLAIIDPATGGQRAVVTRVQLERLVRRGCPDHPGADCSCTVLDRPDPVERYRPTPDQYRFVRTRDRICRHPGCHTRRLGRSRSRTPADGGSFCVRTECCR